MEMQSQLVRYFAAEKAQSWLFVAAGVMAVAVSVWLVRTGSSYRGMAWPLVAVGLIQVVAGLTVGLRTDGQVAQLTAQLAASPQAFQATELPRMTTAMRSFELYKAIQVVLLLVGVGLTYAFRQREYVYGVGMGLVMQASLTLVLDLFAERRGEEYLQAVRALSAPVQASASGVYWAPPSGGSLT